MLLVVVGSTVSEIDTLIDKGIGSTSSIPVWRRGSSSSIRYIANERIDRHFTIQLRLYLDVYSLLTKATKSDVFY